MDSTPNLTLPYIIAAQAQKHVTHNEAIRGLDAIVQLMVLDKDLASPPGSPSDGDRYIVAGSPTGAWAGQTAKVAAWQDGVWTFYVPREGWLAWVADEGKIYVHDGSTWGEITVAVGSGAALWGINATADTTNRLALKSPASLFDNVGAGHQQKINKAAAGDTASQLFQTGYSGRAEYGLTGDDDFHVKVSADGSSWLEALVIDRSTGEARFPISTRFVSGFDQPINFALAASVASNALTIAVKGADGNDPSASNPVFVPFRSATLTDGKPYWRKITAALSLTIPSGATMGFANGVPGRVWVTLIDNAGTVLLGAQNCVVGGASPTRIAGLNESGVVTTTAVDTAADNAAVMYAASAVSAKAFRIAGYLTWETALSTAGTWSVGPDVIALFGPGVPRPGTEVDVVHATNSTQFSTTSSTFQTTNLSAQITPKSKANLVQFLANGTMDVSANAVYILGQVHRDSTAVGVLTRGYTTAGGESFFGGSFFGLDAPGSTSALTYAVKIKNSNNSTTVYFAAGNDATVMTLKELMG